MAGMRGYCVAFLTAFDKHWNLALQDVREVWTRRKSRKVPALGKAPDHHGASGRRGKNSVTSI
jgi:small nuclear ribonucleoprotein (snRNP)-like protein